jgi:hippurate hydrolase
MDRNPHVPWRVAVCASLLLICVTSGLRAADAASGPSAASAEEIRALVQKEYPALEALYQHIHSHPELSLAEARTGKRLADELRAAGYQVTEHVGGHGVVAVLENGKGKTLLVRTELDALPVREETGAPYASTVTTTDPSGRTLPVMHACGHDVHITSIVGVARAMVGLKDRWHGTLVLIGQPAEEVIQGAHAMLKDGLFTRFPRPDWCLAMHVDAELEAGKIGYVSGFALANSDSVDIVVRGVGGHGANPDKTKDPVVLAAQIVLGLQTIASRETKPTDPVVVTVGTIQGGTKRNIIPNEVVLQLTVRTYKDDVRERTLKAIDRIAKGTAIAAGVPKELEPVVTVSEDESTPATYNTPELVEHVTGVFKRVLGPDNVIEREPVMGAEDFGRFGRTEPKVPIFMYRLGSVPPEKVAESKRTGVALPSLHSSRYLPQRKETIETGVFTMTAAALDLLSK